MATTLSGPSGSRQLQDTQYRIVTNDPQDPNNGATCFLKGAQALGFGLPDEVHAYAAGRECRTVVVPKDTIKDFVLV